MSASVRAHLCKAHASVLFPGCAGLPALLCHLYGIYYDLVLIHTCVYACVPAYQCCQLTWQITARCSCYPCACSDPIVNLGSFWQQYHAVPHISYRFISCVAVAYYHCIAKCRKVPPKCHQVPPRCRHYCGILLPSAGVGAQC